MVVLVDGFFFFSGIVLDGSIDRSVEFLQLVNDVVEGFLGEGRSNLDKGKDWVRRSNLGKLSKNKVIIIGVGLDGL